MRIANYLKAKYAELNVPARITGGKMFRLVKGKWTPDAVFMANNPVRLEPTARSKENPDRKSAALN